MPVAAIPGYLAGQDFSTASPGLRFGMFLPIWGINNRTGEALWTTHDINYRVAGANHREREYQDENKTNSLHQAIRLGVSDTRLMEALEVRQAAMVSESATADQVLTIDAIATAPFTTGLGNEHPTENGFAFLNPYGLPYLPGSGVKGVLRQSARELASGQWGDRLGWDDHAIEVLFGKDARDGKDHQRGALTFWDVVPVVKGGKLLIEVMTGHLSHYYQKGESPHESGQPVPINFLTVPPGSTFSFQVQCDLLFLKRLDGEDAIAQDWKRLLPVAFAHAFVWLGFGAKTAVGYGAMTEDRQKLEQRQKEAEQRRERIDAERAMARRTAGLPEDAAWIEQQFDESIQMDNSRFLELVETFLAGHEQLSAQASERLYRRMEDRWSGIMNDPDAVSGKKKKPKYKDRPRELARRIIGMP